MAYTGKIPTSADIYLEVGGVKVAVVQSYRATATRGGKPILAFGQEEPVATIGGVEEYTLELTRIYATETGIRDGINFFQLDDFDMVVYKPDRAIMYTGCRWTKLEESAEVGGTVMEKVTLTAAKRTESKRN